MTIQLKKKNLMIMYAYLDMGYVLEYFYQLLAVR